MIISDKFRALLHTAESICVLTGAGISAESGVETFRGSNGLWSKLKPEELANFDAFMRNPELVWEWYNLQKENYSRCETQPGALCPRAYAGISKRFHIGHTEYRQSAYTRRQ